MSRAVSLPAVAVVLSAWFGVAACGGAVASDLLGNGSKADSGSSAPVDSGPAQEQDSGEAPVDAGTPTIDAVAVIDSGPGAPVDATPVEEAAPPTGPRVSCPMNGAPAMCEPGDTCCVTGDPMLGSQTFGCQGPGAACAGTVVQCTVPADCPTGEVCCGTEQATGQTTTYTQVGCATSCNGNSMRTFCDPATPNTCPPQTPTCGMSMLLPGYSVCQ